MQLTVETKSRAAFINLKVTCSKKKEKLKSKVIDFTETNDI